MDTTLPNDTTRDIWQKDRAHFLHPWTHFDSFREEGSLILDRAEGVYTYDAHGKRYLDGIGGLWCMNIGYGRDEMVDAIADQTRRMAYANPFVDVTNAPAALLTAKLAELAPGDLNKVMLTCGGSTANDSMVRLIHFYWGCKGQKSRKKIITRRGSYHGSTYITQSMTGKPGDRMPEFHYDTDMVVYVSEPNMYRPVEGVAEEDFEQWLIDEFRATIEREGPENIAAHFAEPILGAGGVVVPPSRYIRETREICREHGILYIADEVVTAFGRVGAWFASKDVMGIQPDGIVCAKGLTSGYQPLGAAIFSDAIYDVIAEAGHDRWFTNGYTYAGHPVACAAALKNIEIMERENLPAYVADDIGPYFMERLNTLRDLPTVGDIRGKNLMACVVNVADTDTREEFPHEVDIGKRIAAAAEKRGLLVRPVGNLNIMSPPLTITRAEVDELVDTLRAAMEDVIADLRREGHLPA
ncbi:aminotransferase [Shimia biformata]|uniref:aminotransferase n=1 Tax=Shimia biformata TaxID=1294299 RepID=UPI00195138A7|nr:aminotransferase [Shimia biformata]